MYQISRLQLLLVQFPTIYFLQPEVRRFTTAPNASPKWTSKIKLGASGDDGSSKPGSRKEKDALDPPSANCAFHANTTTTLDLPPESPSLRSVAETDATIMGHSLRGPNSERTGL
ncbi:hypothetical protein EDB84DRAFT_1580972 [Lactarius hengduanensis]|nr:hypothetical protein EDB84DRAFT_1580972 [Lactarius hengduanensis]